MKSQYFLLTPGMVLKHKRHCSELKRDVVHVLLIQLIVAVWLVTTLVQNLLHSEKIQVQHHNLALLLFLTINVLGPTNGQHMEFFFLLIVEL